MSVRRGTILRAVTRHELRVLWRDGTARLALLALIACLAYGVWTGTRWSAFQEDSVRAGVQREAEVFGGLEEQAREWAAQGATASPDAFALHPGYIGLFYPRFAGLPPGPAAPLSVGQSDIRPYYYWVNGERRDSWLDQEELENPQNLLAGRFDLGFVVVFLLPIILLGLSFDLLSREREQGTLQLIASQPVPMGTLTVGKILARWLLVMAALLLVMIPAGLWMGLVEAAPGALLLWTGAVGGYALFWLLLAAAVNTVTRGSAANGILLLSAWLLLVVVVPPILNRTVAFVHPLPPRAELIETTRALETEVRVDPGALVERYYDMHPDLRPAGFDPERYNFPLFWTAIQREVDLGMEAILSREREAIEAQERLARGVAALSPAVLLQNLGDALAGTDLPRNRRFLEAVLDFHEEHRSFFERRAYGHRTLLVEEYQQMPTFRGRADDLEPRIFAGVPFGLLLLAWVATIGFLLRQRIRRIDPG